MPRKHKGGRERERAQCKAQAQAYRGVLCLPKSLAMFTLSQDSMQPERVRCKMQCDFNEINRDIHHMRWRFINIIEGEKRRENESVDLK